MKQNMRTGRLLAAFAALCLLLAGCGGTQPGTTAGQVATPGAATIEPTAPPAATIRPSPGAVEATPVKTGATPAAPTATAGQTGAGDWTMYHHDPARTGYIPGMPDPQQLAMVWSGDLDGAVYAQPLTVGNHVLVATESNTIYSLQMQTGQVEWKTTIGPPVPRSALPCGNIDPLGITGTPVYDPASGLLFAVAEVSGPQHLLVGVDIKTGEVKVRRSIDPPGMEARSQQERAALALYKDMVYVAFGGLFGDCGQYHGWVVGSHTDGQGDLQVFKVTEERAGGIWAPPGPVMDVNGNLYVSVGNSDATSGEWDGSDSVLRLSPVLKREDGFAPATWQRDNATDADLGSLAPVLLPNKLAFIAGKSGTGYLLHADALGGVDKQIQSMPVCRAFGGAAVIDSRIFLPCTNGVREVRVDGSGQMSLGWQAPNQVSGSPVAGGHTIYSLDPRGTLYALDSESGKVRTSVPVGTTSRFSTPTLAGGFIFVGTIKGIIAVKGS